MTREEQLRYCKVCKNQKFDLQQGIICSLTNTKADFEDSCDSFENESGDDSTSYLSDFAVQINSIQASQGKRFLNFIIDYIFLHIIVLIIGVLGGFAAVLVGIPIEDYYFNLGPIEEKIIDYLVVVLFGTIYYTTFESLTGRSLGKYITKTKVVTEDGEKPEFRTILIRSLCRYVPFNAFSFLNSEASGWHDQWSKTKVVEI